MVRNNYSFYQIHGDNKFDLETMLRIVNIRYKNPWKGKNTNRVCKNDAVNRKHNYILHVCLYHEDYKDLMRLKHIKKGENNKTYHYVEA